MSQPHGGPPSPNLDRLFVEVAYDRRSRMISLIAEGVCSALIGLAAGAQGWTAAAIAAALGVPAGWLDRRMILAHWERMSTVRMRDLLEQGRQKVLPPQSLLRSVLPLIGVAAGAAALLGSSERSLVLRILVLPLLYLAWLFGRDLVLLIAPPRGQ